MARSPTAPPSAEQRPRVLVVDDDGAIRRVVCRAFAAEHDATEACDGQDGLEKAIALKPDLVITDMTMPRKTGEQLVLALRDRRDFDIVPIMLLTAINDEDLRVRLLNGGAQDYVVKPFAAAEVLVRAKNLIATKRVREVLQHELGAQARDLEVLAREVTCQKRHVEAALDEMTIARDDAAEASAVKSAFLRLVSHELRTPLTVMQLELQSMVRQSAGRPPAEQKSVERIAAASHRLATLVESVLERTRVDAERTKLRVERFDLGTLAEEVAEELSASAAEKRISIDVRVASGTPPLVSDRRIVRRILRALVDNAVKFTAAGGVEIAIDAQSARARVAVKDTGPGIRPLDRPRIFRAFETLEPVHFKHTPGLGLGLAIVRASAQMLGGNVELSSSDDKGSVFTVTLPSLDVTTAIASDDVIAPS